MPEWRYFDEQLCKAETLEQAGLAAVSRTWPSHVEGWRKLWDAASRLEIEAQRSLIDTRAASGAADWLDQLMHSIWAGSRQGVRPESVIS